MKGRELYMGILQFVFIEKHYVLGAELSKRPRELHQTSQNVLVRVSFPEFLF